MVQYPGNQALNAAALYPVAHDHFLRSKEPRREVAGGAFHLRKKPGNFGGSDSGISDW